MTLDPIFPKDDPDDELVECPMDWCEALAPVAGPTGVVRHLLAVHPEALLTRAIFARLVEVQLADTETCAEVMS